MSYESPVHSVSLRPYKIGVTEVSQALWKAVMGSNPSLRQGDDLPVENVSWYEVQEFIEKLNAESGMHFRLPTEAEWEFAARAGGSPNEPAGGKRQRLPLLEFRHPLLPQKRRMPMVFMTCQGMWRNGVLTIFHVIRQMLW